jgi:hypothetical protein
VVEDEAVLAAAGLVVQAQAQVLEDALVARDAGGLAGRDDVLLRELGQSCPARGEPEDRSGREDGWAP